MGTTISAMLRRALSAAGRPETKVYAVSRFSRSESRRELEALGVATVPCDLTEPDEVSRLPLAANVLFLAGQKFGTSSAPAETWVQNTFSPALAVRQYRASRIVAFSTGCVYPFVPVDSPGANESTPPAFCGDYASSCTGRERIFDYYSRSYGARVLQFRLNYSVELRYGVLVDIADKVVRGEPIDVTMGYFNCIWQGDACARAIQCLEYAASPARVLNITGPKKLSIREVANRFGELLDRPPILTGCEAPTAWLADASESLQLFGPPVIGVDTMMALIARYLRSGGTLLGKPTHFEQRDGKF